MEAADGAAGAAGAGSGSGVVHAFPPQGSMVEEGMLAVTAGVGTVEVSCLGGDGGGGLRLKADFISSWGEIFGGGAAAGAGGGDERPNKSSEGDEIGGSGFFGGDGCGACGGGGDAKSVKPISCPKDEIEALRDWCCGAGGDVGEVRLSNKLTPPLADAVGADILGAAGVDFLVAKLVRLANGDGFSAGFGAGGEVVDGMLSPLKASVIAPIFEDEEGGGGDAISPNEGVRWCWAGAG